MKRLMKVLVLCFLAQISSLAEAQSCSGSVTDLVVDPTNVCFQASADHDALNAGQPMVTSYRLLFFLEGVSPDTGAPINGPGIDLGKPTPAGVNKIIQMSRAELGAIPIGQRMFAVVDTIGPTTPAGAARSPRGNPFERSNPNPARPAGAPIIGRP